MRSIPRFKKYVSFKIAALLFTSPYRRLKKGGIFKTSILVDSIEAFLYCLSSSYLTF